MNGNGPQIRTDSPTIRDVSSPNRSVLSSTKSWCSSPFSNLAALSPDNNSLTFSLADLSPSLTFSSPRYRFSDLASPQSSNRPKDYNAIFSPSLFSPFNKSLAPNKMDKLMIDTDEIDPNQSRLLAGIDETPDIFQRTQSILPQLLKAADYQADGSHRNNLNESGFDFEDVPNESPGARSTTSSRFSQPFMMSETLSPNGPPSSSSSSGLHGTNILGRKPSLPPKQSSGLLLSGNGHETRCGIGKQISSIPSPQSNYLSPPVIAKAKQTNMSPSMEQKSHCNCKKSRCLKLYCDCFASLRYCSSCNCTDCNNCAEFEVVRQDAIQLTKDRNPSAFQLKVSVKRGHMAGCNCKKSRCLKKYCECFEGAVFCGPNCKCVECQNLAGSEALKLAKSSLRDKRDRVQRIDLNESDVHDTHTEIKSSLSSPKLPPQDSPLDDVSATPFKNRSRRFTENDECKTEYEAGGAMSEMMLPTAITSTESPPHSTHSSNTDLEISPDPSSSSIGSPDFNSSNHHPLKKRRVHDSPPEKREPMYPFFGPHLPPITKLIALSCLEYLDGPSLYSISCVNRIWSQAAMDDALWE